MPVDQVDSGQSRATPGSYVYDSGVVVSRWGGGSPSEVPHTPSHRRRVLRCEAGGHGSRAHRSGHRRWHRLVARRPPRRRESGRGSSAPPARASPGHRPPPWPRGEVAGEGAMRVVGPSHVGDRAGDLSGPRHERARQVVAAPGRRAGPMCQPCGLASHRAGDAVADFRRRHGGDASQQASGAHHGRVRSRRPPRRRRASRA